MGNDHTEKLKNEKLQRPRDRQNSGNVADWSLCDAEILKKVIACASAKHAALRFGYSRDGGAYAIGVYTSGDYFTDYIRPNEDIDDYLRELLESFEDYNPSQESSTPSARGNKRR